MSERHDRKRAELRGRRAERLCRWWLRLKLYRILARDFRVPSGEIDIVARRGRTIIFVEVKARADEATAAFAISTNQRRRIARAAAHFLAARPDLATCNSRFDVMLAAPRRLPRHLADAWRLDG